MNLCNANAFFKSNWNCLKRNRVAPLSKIAISVVLISYCYSPTYSQEIDDVYSANTIHKIKDTVAFNQVLDSFANLFYTFQTHKVPYDIDDLIRKAQQLDYANGLARAYFGKGEILFQDGKYDESIAQKLKIIPHFKKTNNNLMLARIYETIGGTEYEKGRFQKSVSYMLKAKNYYTKLNNPDALINIYYNIANSYAASGDNTTATEYYEKSIELMRSIKEARGAALFFSSFAMEFITEGKFKKARALIKEGISIGIQRKDPSHGIGDAYKVLADLDFKEKKYLSADLNYDIALSYYKGTIGLDRYIESIKMAKAKVAIQFKQYKKAQTILKATRYKLKQMGTYHLGLNYAIQVQLDSAQGNLTSALHWLKVQQKLKDSIRKEDTFKNLQGITEEQKDEILQLEKIRKQQLQVQQSSRNVFKFRVYTTVGVIAVLGSFFILFSVLEFRKKRKNLINELHKSNQIKNKLFSIISHDLKNEIFALNASLGLMKNNEMSALEFQEILPLLVQRTNQTSILLNNLLNWSKSQMNELNAKPMYFDISEMIAHKFEFFKPKAVEKNIQLINKIKKTIVHADKDMIGIVTQNLIANAVKFCKSGDTISLFCNDTKDSIEIGFSDSGVGIAPEHIPKLFSEEAYTTNGTQNETGTGLGLRICQELVTLNHGQIRVESFLGKGTTFFVTLPKGTP